MIYNNIMYQIDITGPIGVGKGIATVDGKKVCEAEITFAIG